MNVRVLSLVLATTALSAFVGCASTQSGPRGDTASAQASAHDDAQLKGKGHKCACALKGKGPEGAVPASTEQGSRCGCPHCAHGASATDDAKRPACGCSHEGMEHGGSEQASDSVR